MSGRNPACVAGVTARRRERPERLAQPEPIPPYMGNFGPGTITLP